MPSRRTQEQFIEAAQVKHKNFYDYSKVRYVKSDLKVVVTCPEHGDFEITPSHHLNSGAGCRKCFADRQRNSQDIILDRFRKAHGDRYSYNKVIYEQMNLAVVIGCPVHNDFKQTPVSHANGSGCPRCGNDERPLTTEEFIERARAKHGDKYDYSQVQYVKNSTKVIIICPNHGSFDQLAANHISKSRASGCPQCGKEDGIKTQFGFEYSGIHYRSIKHACQKLGKDYWSIVKRLDAGWTLEQAFDGEPRDPRHLFVVDGIIYNGIVDAVRQLNAPVSAHTVRRRLEEGISPEEALFTPPKLGYDNGVIYVVTNLANGKQYVGLTTTSLEERWERHLNQSRKQASLIHKAIIEFGEESFALDTLDRADDIKDLRKKEREWIQKLNTLSPNGYNVTLGGEVGGSPGKPTRLPGDPILYPSVKEASVALARSKSINQEAAEKRIYTGRIDIKKPHGMSKTRIYRCWDRLVYQIANPKSRDYNGSTVCVRWKDFANFYEDMGKDYRDGFCLKPINPRLPYSKKNCQWTPRSEVYKKHPAVAKTVAGVQLELF